MIGTVTGAGQLVLGEREFTDQPIEIRIDQLETRIQDGILPSFLTPSLDLIVRYPTGLEFACKVLLPLTVFCRKRVSWLASISIPRSTY